MIINNSNEGSNIIIIIIIIIINPNWFIHHYDIANGSDESKSSKFLALIFKIAITFYFTMMNFQNIAPNSNGINHISNIATIRHNRKTCPYPIHLGFLK